MFAHVLPMSTVVSGLEWYNFTDAVMRDLLNILLTSQRRLTMCVS